MQNPLESEEAAFRFVLGTIVYFAPIVVAAWIATWLGVIVFVVMSVRRLRGAAAADGRRRRPWPRPSGRGRGHAPDPRRSPRRAGRRRDSATTWCRLARRMCAASDVLVVRPGAPAWCATRCHEERCEKLRRRARPGRACALAASHAASVTHRGARGCTGGVRGRRDRVCTATAARRPTAVRDALRGPVTDVTAAASLVGCPRSNAVRAACEPATCRRRSRRTPRRPRSACRVSWPLNGGIGALPFVTRSFDERGVGLRVVEVRADVAGRARVGERVAAGAAGRREDRLAGGRVPGAAPPPPSRRGGRRRRRRRAAGSPAMLGFADAGDGSDVARDVVRVLALDDVRRHARALRSTGA